MKRHEIMNQKKIYKVKESDMTYNIWLITFILISLKISKILIYCTRTPENQQDCFFNFVVFEFFWISEVKT